MAYAQSKTVEADKRSAEHGTQIEIVNAGLGSVGVTDSVV